MQFYKLLSSNLRHLGFQYKEGLNINTEEFIPGGSCEPGGLYYTSHQWIGRWFNRAWPLIADVTLPPDARIYPEPCGTKWKADRLVLSNIRPIEAFLAEQSHAQLVEWMKQSDNGQIFALMPQTPELCTAAINFRAWNIQMLHKQTPELCALAVSRNWTTIQAVGHVTVELLELAMETAPEAFGYIGQDKQTPELCLAAVKRNGMNLRCVVERTDEVCLAAVRQIGCAIACVKNPTPPIKAAAAATACPTCRTMCSQ